MMMIHLLTIGSLIEPVRYRHYRHHRKIEATIHKEPGVAPFEENVIIDTAHPIFVIIPVRVSTGEDSFDHRWDAFQKP